MKNIVRDFIEDVIYDIKNKEIATLIKTIIMAIVMIYATIYLFIITKSCAEMIISEFNMSFYFVSFPFLIINASFIHISYKLIYFTYDEWW